MNYYNPYQARTNDLIRVNGRAGAEAYQMMPNGSVALFDGNKDIFYVKTTDGAGFGSIREFEFKEREPEAPEDTYVGRKEFDEFKKEVAEIGKQLIQYTKQIKQQPTEHTENAAG